MRIRGLGAYKYFPGHLETEQKKKLSMQTFRNDMTGCPKLECSYLKCYQARFYLLECSLLSVPLCLVSMEGNVNIQGMLCGSERVATQITNDVHCIEILLIY